MLRMPETIEKEEEKTIEPLNRENDYQCRLRYNKDPQA